MLYYYDKKYHFFELFNEDNGFLFRSDIENKPGNDPVQRSFPELLDIGIMGHCHISHLNICKNAGIDCYQKAMEFKARNNMSLSDYKRIIDESKGKVFQVALGGAGDPNKHENIEEILKYTRTSCIVPNLTTSGIFIAEKEIDLLKEYCGGVAISYYSRLIKGVNGFYESNDMTNMSIKSLVNAGCSVNIHYVLSKETIKEALTRLKNGIFPDGIKAIIFVLYKPVGNGIQEKCLDSNDPVLKEFLSYIQENSFDFDIGFDTCCTPAIVANNKSISFESIDACEAARFSMYIDCNLVAYPCSFDCGNNNYAVSIRNRNISTAWNFKEFNEIREKQSKSCKKCNYKKHCRGGCALDLPINLCGMKFEE